MAIDPRILSAIGVDTQGTTRALNAFTTIRDSQDRSAANKEALSQSQQQAPLRQELLQAQVDSAKIGNQRDLRKDRLLNVTQRAQSIIPDLKSGNFDAVRAALTAGGEEAAARGVPTNDTQDALALLESNPQALLDASNRIVERGFQTGILERGPNQQFGSQQTFKDDAGNLFFGTTRRNPQTGTVESVLSSVSGDGSNPQGQVSLVSGLGQTAAEKTASAVDVAQQTQDIKTSGGGREAALKAGVAQSTKAFEKLPIVRTAIGNYTEAISSLDAGAETGTIDRLLPSLRTASKELDNTIKRLGLDVVGNTTFGALSESELQFALQAAIPDNLQPAELRQWLVAKRNAQQKILQGLDEVAIFLGDGTKTVADFRNKQIAERLSAETPAAAPVQTPSPAPAAQTPQPGQTQQIGRFTVEIVN